MEALQAKIAARRPVLVTALLYDSFELLDLYGPLEMLGMCNSRAISGRSDVFDIKVVQAGGCATELSPQVVADFHVSDAALAARGTDILLLPGGKGWVGAAHDAALMEWLQAVTASAGLVLSVCTGAGLLCTLGRLDGKRATTNKRAMKDMQREFPLVNWVERARWTNDGRYFTSSGVSAGTDMTLEIVRVLVSARVARRVAHAAEYVGVKGSGDDPFVGNIKDMPEPALARGALQSCRVGLVLYDNFELYDTFAPLEMMAVANRYFPGLFTLKTAAATATVKSSRGPSFEVGSAGLMADFFDDVDLIFVPGGLGSIRESNNAALLAWLGKGVDSVSRIFTVCSGSQILAATGRLAGKKATTNKLSYNIVTKYGPKVRWQPDARFVVDGKFMTSSGVSAGGDLALHIIGDLFGTELADAVGRRAEFVRTPDAGNDPFAKNVPPLTLAEKVKVGLITTAANAFFSIGLALGFKFNTSSMPLVNSLF